MATLIDSLYVSLGLDPTEYKKGQKEAVDASKKTKEAAVRDAKAIEEAGKKAADGIKKIAVEALALFAIFTGSKSIGKFVTDLMGADAALGRFSRTVGLAPQYVAAIGKVVGEVGGTAEATAGTIDGLSSSLTRFRTANGDLPQEFWQLRALVGGKIDPRGSMVDFLDQLAAALQKVERTDPQKAAMYARALSIDPGTYQLMLKYGQELSKVIGLRKDLAPSQQDIENAQKFQEAWNNIFNAVQNLIEKGIRAIEPALTPIVKRMQEWVEANKAVISDKIVEYANSIASAFKSAADNISTVVSVLKALDDFNERSKKWEITKFLNGSAFNSNTPENSTTYGDPNGMLSASVRKGSIAESIINYFSGGSDKVDGARAAGGPVSAGRRYLVGEHGPEVLDASSNGTIIPNDKLGGNLSVDGRPINRANPMPVTLSNAQGGGENWLQTLGKWLGFGGSGGSSGGSGGGFFSAVGGALKKAVGASSSGGNSGEDVGTFSGAKAGRVSGQMGDRAKRLMDRLTSVHGWTSAAAAIAAGNAQQESGIRSDGPMGDPSVPGGSWGMFQWNRSRLAALKKFGGANWRDFNVQVDFFAKEAERMLPSWKKQQDLSNAGRIGKAYEGYGDNSTGTRVANAQNWLRAYRMPPASGASGGVLTGAKGAAVAAGNTTNNNQRSSTSSSVTNVNGPITVTTQAKDANGIAASLHDSIRRNATASAANNGPN